MLGLAACISRFHIALQVTKRLIIRLIHGQSVVEDTQQNIKVVQAKIDLLLQQDVDRRALVSSLTRSNGFRKLR